MVTIAEKAERLWRRPLALATTLLLTATAWSATALASAHAPAGHPVTPHRTERSVAQQPLGGLDQGSGESAGGGASSEGWPMFRFDSAHTAFNQHLTTLHKSQVPQLQLRPGWPFDAGDTVASSPAVVDRVAYVGSHDMHLNAVDVHGKLLWRFPTNGDVMASPAVVATRSSSHPLTAASTPSARRESNCGPSHTGSGVRPQPSPRTARPYSPRPKAGTSVSTPSIQQPETSGGPTPRQEPETAIRLRRP